ncbi:phage minor tail protein L [Salmonella enterica]
MPLTLDVQKLEPGNTVRLVEVDGSAFGMPDVLRFHAYNIAHTPEDIAAAGGNIDQLDAKSLWWQGQEYRAWPYQVEGVSASTDGTEASVKLTVANLDASITALCLAFDDMLKAKVTLHNTLARYLDARNFPDGNAGADPTQETRQTFYVNAKSAEDNEQVQFELSSPVNLQGLMIPTRQLHSLCEWCIRGKYRSGDGCDYAGSAYFDKDNNPIADPSRDVCAGTVAACQARHGEHNELPFGGFVGTSLIHA